jgi:DNA modification methylase
MSQIVINADNIKALKEYPDNYFDAVVTDPPYGLGKEPDAAELMKDWVQKGYHEITGTGFMGKEWDAFVPQPIFWKEVFRVLKHGGHVVSFFGTRTYDWGVMAMRFAGFEVRDCIQWIYGSGFPKSHNIGKAIDKIKGNEREVIGERKVLDITGGNYKNSFSETNKEYFFTKGNSIWEGWGSALKPANEPIVLARKPLEKGLSIAENVLKWGTGGINIDGCRVGIEERTYKGSGKSNQRYSDGRAGLTDGRGQDIEFNAQGRFPANLILTHHPECECKGLKKVKGMIDKPTNRTEMGNTWDDDNSGLRKNMPKNSGGYADENGEETIEDWDCHEDCPIRIMDEQSGISKTGDIKPHKVKGTTTYGNGNGFFLSRDYIEVNFKGDVGGASRFFYCAKASKSERNKGLEDFDDKLKMTQMRSANGSGEKNFEGGFQDQIMKNVHPTVKPVKLMQYLVRLITPPNGKVLDPFCGSGTTGIACKLEGFEFVGLEQDGEYSKIAQSRIDNYEEEIEEIVYVTNNEGEKVQITQTSLF